MGEVPTWACGGAGVCSTHLALVQPRDGGQPCNQELARHSGPQAFEQGVALYAHVVQARKPRQL